jgi:hypothetical protein
MVEVDFLTAGFEHEWGKPVRVSPVLGATLGLFDGSLEWFFTRPKNVGGTIQCRETNEAGWSETRMDADYTGAEMQLRGGQGVGPMRKLLASPFEAPRRAF